MKEYYVVLRRNEWDGDYVTIYDKEEAKKGNWIDDNGDRIWVVPYTEEHTPTFVWGFDDLESAMTFYDAMITNAVGIKVTANNEYAKSKSKK